LTLYTNICKRIRQVAPPAVGLASKLKLFWLVNLLPWPLNGVTYHPCHGHPSCQTLACYTFPFSTYGQARDRQTDGQTDRRRPSTL